jgi:hypothetical protein
MKTTFLAWTPFTGLGAYGGFRGNRWLRNRIKVFKQFVIPSLMDQTDRDFIHWVAWRPEEISNPHVRALEKYMKSIPGYKTVFTFGGLCFWDDKYDNNGAREKLTLALHRTMPDLLEVVPEEPGVKQDVQVLLVPSDDIYERTIIERMKKHFEANPLTEAIGLKRGYICNYNTLEMREYNPKTNPPFFAARFPRDVFFDINKHLDYISMKQDEGKYKAGTPYPSHEYIPNAFKMDFFEDRAFLVGTHGENISTHFNNPFGGEEISPGKTQIALVDFGIYSSGKLHLPLSLRKAIIRRLPHKWQRKLRYLIGEKVFQKFYNFIRN